jgi:hypothetical protein
MSLGAAFEEDTRNVFHDNGKLNMIKRRGVIVLMRDG